MPVEIKRPGFTPEMGRTFGHAIGAGLGLRAQRQGRAGAPGGIEADNNSGEPENLNTIQYAGRLLGIIGKYGMEPGPVFQTLVSTHEQRSKERAAIAEEERKAALEAQQRSELAEAAYPMLPDTAEPEGVYPGMAGNVSVANLSPDLPTERAREYGGQQRAILAKMPLATAASFLTDQMKAKKEKTDNWEYNKDLNQWVKKGTRETAPLGMGQEPPAKQKEPPSFKDVMALRNDYQAEVKVATTAKDVNGKIHAAWDMFQRGEPGSGATAEQALMVLFQKMLDPTSVVRESEYARTAEGQSLLARLEARFRQWKEGGAGVSPEILGAIVSLSDQFYGSHKSYLNQRRKDYTTLAERWNIDPRDIVDMPEARKKDIGPPPVPGRTVGEVAEDDGGNTYLWDGKRWIGGR